MVRFVVKGSFQLLIFFLILSYPIKDRPLFSHLGEVTQPYVKSFFDLVDEGIHKTISNGKKLGRKFFSNSVPQKFPEAAPKDDESGMGPDAAEGSDSLTTAFDHLNQRKFLHAEKSVGDSNLLQTEWTRINQFIHESQGD